MLQDPGALAVRIRSARLLLHVVLHLDVNCRLYPQWHGSVGCTLYSRGDVCLCAGGEAAARADCARH